jgi:malonyl-CoA O-methyltransferase
VRLNCEYLPATEVARQELVLLHGWGVSPSIWRTLLIYLRPWANLRLLELPGCAPGADLDGGEPALQDILAGILAQGPQQAVYLGWSLGGQLAMVLAAQNPDRVAGIITVCSNPCFVSREDWPGMPASTFAAFCAAFRADPAAALRRFDSLQVSGSPRSRARMRQLQKLDRRPASEDLQYGLHWLETLDQRAALPDLNRPQLHLLAQSDELVPAALAQSLEQLLSQTPGARVRLLQGSSHVATLDTPAQVVQEAREFLADSDLLPAVAVQPELLAKRDVADSFSRAARVYDSVAQLQRDVGEELLRRLDTLNLQPEAVLDLGSGTGYCCPALQRRFPRADYYGLDIAEGMVVYARGQQQQARGWLVGDAEALPLANDCMDLVFSSLAVQWCYRPQLLFAELARVLRPGGFCVFTSLGPGTLRELRAAWAAVDDHQHVNRFLPVAALQNAASGVPGVHLSLDTHQFRMHYQRVGDLLNELKTLGAHNMNRDRPGGLTSRRTLQGMLQAYECWREEGLLPASYDVVVGVMEKL